MVDAVPMEADVATGLGADVTEIAGLLSRLAVRVDSSLAWFALEPDAPTRAAVSSGAEWSMSGGSPLPLPGELTVVGCCEVLFFVFGVGLDPPPAWLARVSDALSWGWESLGAG